MRWRSHPRGLVAAAAVAFAAMTGAAGLAAPASSSSGSLTGHVITRIPTHARVLALTFDGGANRDGAASILATLRADKVAATFFLTGDFVQNYPRLSRRLAKYGRVGNHSLSHPDLTTLSDRGVRRQVRHARALITSITGEDPKSFFRFPFGAYDSRTLADVNNLGFLAIGWTVDSHGWMGTADGTTVSAVVHRVVSARARGAIVLMHLGSNPDDHSTLDADALPRIITRLRAHGYRFVTLDALLR